MIVVIALIHMLVGERQLGRRTQVPARGKLPNIAQLGTTGA
jgi:hypothetical protein